MAMMRMINMMMLKYSAVNKEKGKRNKL